MKFTEINELKGIAIILIVYYHVCGIIQGSNVLQGQIGVDIFIVLSGTGMALGYPSIRNSWEFLYKRFRKIMPSYWIVLTCFSLGDIFILSRSFEDKNFIYHLLGIHSYIGDSYIFGYSNSFWYISLVLLLYIAYIPVSKFVESGKTQHIITIGLSLTLIIAIYFSVFIPSVTASFHIVLRIPDFFIGIILGMYLRNPNTKLNLNIPSTLLMFVTMFLILHKEYAFYYPLIGVTFVLFYFKVSQFFERYYYLQKIRVFFAMIGSISYEIYLIHEPLISKYNNYFVTQILHWSPSPHRMEFGMLIMFVVVILLSILLNRLFTVITVQTKSSSGRLSTSR